MESYYKRRARMKDEISNYLENECCFRDYYFAKASQFGKLDRRNSINILRPKMHELDDALSRFRKDGIGSIIIYL